MACGGNEVWYLIIFVDGDGLNVEPERKKRFLWTKVLCRRNARKELGWIGSRKVGTAGESFSGWRQNYSFQSPSHHNRPLRNMLALFNSLKKSDASAVVRPVTFWLFLSG